MLFNKTTFIGIDPTAGKRPFVYAAIDYQMRLLALGRGDMDEIMAFLGGQQQAFVAVNAPQQPNQGLMAQDVFREQLAGPPKPGRWIDYRVAEYFLIQRGIKIPRTPAPGKKTPGWIKMGFLTFDRLRHLGYVPYPDEGEQHQFMEVYPHGIYVALLGRVPFKKNTLEGRLQRQLVLYDLDFDVPDPMRIFEEFTRHRFLQGVLPLDQLHSPSELEAMAAAYTAFIAGTKPEAVSIIGEPREGQLIFPVPALKKIYR